MLVRLPGEGLGSNWNQRGIDGLRRWRPLGSKVSLLPKVSIDMQANYLCENLQLFSQKAITSLVQKVCSCTSLMDWRYLAPLFPVVLAMWVASGNPKIST